MITLKFISEHKDLITITLDHLTDINTMNGMSLTDWDSIKEEATCKGLVYNENSRSVEEDVNVEYSAFIEYHGILFMGISGVSKELLDVLELKAKDIIEEKRELDKKILNSSIKEDVTELENRYQLLKRSIDTIYKLLKDNQ